jgi:hypothetical protein
MGAKICTIGAPADRRASQTHTAAKLKKAIPASAKSNKSYGVSIEVVSNSPIERFCEAIELLSSELAQTPFLTVSKSSAIRTRNFSIGAGLEPAD